MKFGNLGLRLKSPWFWGGIVLLLLIFTGCFYNLAHYPAIWSDEAIFSKAAANLVDYGRYAFTIQTPNQLKDLDFRISVGPAVILPVALAYKLFGVGLVPGRAVAGLYLLLAFGGLFLGARRLWGPKAALLAVALALLGTDVFYWGRSVVGDVPALALFLLSLWFLLPGMDGDALWPLFLGGLFLGLAFDAKEFYGLAFLPPLGLLLRQHWQQRRRLGLALLTYLGGLSLPLLGYLLLKTIILGSLTGAVMHFLLQKKLLCHEFFTPLTAGRLYPQSFLYLLGHPLFWLGIFGTAWAWKNRTLSTGACLWVANFFLWSLVYLTAVYWQRFALPALFLASGLGGYFLLGAVERLTASLSSKPHPWLSGGVILAFLILLYPWWGLNYLGLIIKQKSDPPEKVVQFIDQHVPRKCLIETPEYELAFLDHEHRIHLMPSFYFVKTTAKKIVLYNPRPRPYNFEQVGADVLILGSFGKSVFKQIYPASLVSRDWRLLAKVAYYDIYVCRRGYQPRYQPPVLAQKNITTQIKAEKAAPARPKLISH